MKHELPFKRLFTSLLFLALSTANWAYSFYVDGIYYITKSGSSVTVTYKDGDYSCYSGSVVIPSSVNYNGTTYRVTSIGFRAFYHCSITSITIPNSVTSIESEAFVYCYNLKSITIPESVTSIGYNAFNDCISLTKAEFASIESLCNMSFGSGYANPLYFAHNLYIDGQRVKDVTIPNSMTSINNYTFYGCSGLTSITIPESVTSIGDFVFTDCSNLTSITIPESASSIGIYAFAGCSNLTKAEFASIESLCNMSFIHSDSNPLSKAHHLYIGEQEVKDVVIPNSVTSIGNYIFCGCSNLTSVSFHDDVTSIGDGTFSGCSGLTSITIPENVTSIGKSAFSGCSGLTSVTIPNSVTSIGSYVFFKCSGLKSVIIGNSVTSIGGYAFEDCRRLRSITCWAENVPTAGFGNVSYYLLTLYVPASALNDYKSTSPWSNCGTILPIEPSAVDELKSHKVKDVNTNTPIFDLNGRKLSKKPASGYYIQGGKKHLMK